MVKLSRQDRNANFILLLIKNSLFSLRRNNASLVVALVGVTIGVCSLIAITGTMNGMQKLLIDALIHVEAYDYQGQASVNEKNEIIELLKTRKRVDHIVPFIDEFALITGEEGSALVHIRAVGFEESKQDDIFIRALSIPNENLYLSKDDSALPPILLGWGLAGTLGVNPGDTLKILLPGAGSGFIPQEVEMVVSDWFVTDADYDLQWAFMRLDDYLSYVGDSVETLDFGVRVNSQKNIEKILSEKLDNVQSWQEKNNAFYIALKSEKTILIILSAVIFGIIVLHFRFSMIRRIKNKKDDIVSLRSMGASPQQITQWFLGETIAIGLLGTAIGATIGLLYVFKFHDFIDFFSSSVGIMINFGTGEGGSISVREVVYIILFTWFSMILSSWSIVKRNTKFAPMQVLRYE